MREISEVIASILGKESEIEALNKERSEFYQELASLAPVKVGDRVICNGTSFNGKEMVIDKIWSHRSYSAIFYWEARGNIIKKDGTSSLNRGEWSKRIN